jgi:hypothetical protein
MTIQLWRPIDRIPCKVDLRLGIKWSAALFLPTQVAAYPLVLTVRKTAVKGECPSQNISVHKTWDITRQSRTEINRLRLTVLWCDNERGKLLSHPYVHGFYFPRLATPYAYREARIWANSRRLRRLGNSTRSLISWDWSIEERGLVKTGGLVKNLVTPKS